MASIPPPPPMPPTLLNGSAPEQAARALSTSSVCSSLDGSDSEATAATSSLSPTTPIIGVTQHLMSSIQSFALHSLRTPPPPRKAEPASDSGSMASAIEKAILSKRWAFQGDSDDDEDSNSDADSFVSESDEADPDGVGVDESWEHRQQPEITSA